MIRIPDEAAVHAALMALPRATRDRIAFIAVDMVFNGYVHGDYYEVAKCPELKPVQDEAAIGAAFAKEDARLNELTVVIEKALPILFGTDDDHAVWVKALQAAKLREAA